MPDFDWGWSFSFSVIQQTISGGTASRLTPIDDLDKHLLLGPSISKFRWGRGQLASLEQNILQTFSDPANQAVIRADLDPDSGYYVFSINSVPSVGQFAEYFTNAVADVAKNFHPVLDQLAWQLAKVCAAPGEPSEPRRVKFPITDDPQAWTAAEHRSKALFRPEHWTFFERFQPYRGVNGRFDSWQGDYVHPLAFLRDLANDDKHRVSKPIFLLQQQFDFPKGLRVADKDGVFGQKDWIVIGVGKPLELGLEVMRARLVPPAPPEINPAGRCRPQITFSTGDQAVSALQRVERFVHLVLSEFGEEFPAA
jgi:hypothetical protein